MTLAKVIAWYVLTKKGDIHEWDYDEDDGCVLWHFYAEIGNTTVIFDYQIIGDNIKLPQPAHIEHYKERGDSYKCEYRLISDVEELVELLS